MEIYTVEVFHGTEFELVLATEDEAKALAVDENEYGCSSMVVTKWSNGTKEVVYSNV